MVSPRRCVYRIGPLAEFLIKGRGFIHQGSGLGAFLFLLLRRNPTPYTPTPRVTHPTICCKLETQGVRVQGLGFRVEKESRAIVPYSIPHMSYSLNSLRGGYIRDYIGGYYRGY